MISSQVFIVVLYALVILTGVLGNIVVVFAVVHRRNPQTATSVFIASLAFSDVGLCAFSLPLQLHYQLTDNWFFGETLCRAIFAGFAVPMYVSTLTMLLIAYDRYRQIVYPLRDGLTFRNALALVAISLVGSVILSTPVVLFTSISVLSDPDLDIDRHYCVENWPNVEARISYGVLTFAFQFCVPLLVSAVLYYRIYVRLKTRPLRRQRDARRLNTNRILVAIVTLFLVCWSPWNLFSLVTEVDYGLVRGPNFKATDLLLKAFALGSSCVNPFLYCWLNANFRAELQTVASRLRIYGRATPGGASNRATFGRPLEDFASASGVAADVRSCRLSVANRSAAFRQPWNAVSTGGDRIRDRVTVAMTTVTAVVERGQSAV